jgi:hypothetical protein
VAPWEVVNSDSMKKLQMEKFQVKGDLMQGQGYDLYGKPIPADETDEQFKKRETLAGFMALQAENMRLVMVSLFFFLSW